MLVKLLQFKYGGRYEKVAWTIPVKYKEVEFLLGYRKFGLDIRSATNPKSVQEIAIEMVNKLNKGVSIADKLLEPFAKEQLKNKNITVANNFHALNARYLFFRNKAEKSFASSPPKRKIIKRDKTGEPVAWESHPYKPQLEGSYYTIAMMDAFFSKLEHILTLILPFAFDKIDKIDLVSFIGLTWSEKFKQVFNVIAGGEQKRLYDNLIEIKERYRNPLSHGGFEKGGASLYFHFPAVGAIPIRLSKFRESIHYSFIPIREAKFEEICFLFDCVDQFIDNGKYKLGMQYITAGLDVAFDKESVDEYNLAMQSEKNFLELIEYVSYTTMMDMNMDW